MSNVNGYYGIVATKREDKDVWVQFHLRDGRAAERFYLHPPEGKIIAVGHRTYHKDLLLTGWTLNAAPGSGGKCFVHGGTCLYEVPRWAARIARERVK